MSDGNHLGLARWLFGLARWLAFALAVGLVGACAPDQPAPPVRLSGYRAVTIESLAAQGWRTDLTRRQVPLASIRTADLLRDAFVPVVVAGTAAASELSLDDAEPVVVARSRDGLRAWPIVWLLHRELALDELDDAPVAVTFCSLCATARVWDRRVQDDTLQLAVSGMLVNGNSLLYDRRTESLWRQIDGLAIAGAHAGARLRPVPSFVLSFGELRRSRPDARVMLPPSPAPDPPIRLLRPDDVLHGAPPEWLTLACPSPLEPVLEIDAEPGVIRAGGPAVENLASTVVFRDPSCAMPFRDEDGRAAPVTGSAAAFHRRTPERTLTFEAIPGGARDLETGSRWNLLGEAVEGPLAGTRLESAAHSLGFRFALDPAGR